MNNGFVDEQISLNNKEGGSYIVVANKKELWTRRTMASLGLWRSVAWGNGVFVAVSFASGTNCNTSTDGITWTQRTMASTGTWVAIAFGAGVFVALSNTSGTNCNTSTDGITWTQRTMASSRQWRYLAYGNGVFVATGQNTSSVCNTSTDGITWIGRTLAASVSVSALEYGERFIIGLNNQNGIHRSTDGITWVADGIMPNSIGAKNIIWSGDKYLSTLSTVSPQPLTSTDGILWRISPKKGHVFTDGLAAFFKGKYIIVDSGDRVWTSSTDGINWEERIENMDLFPVSQSFGRFAQNENTLVCVGYAHPTPNNVALTLTDFERKTISVEIPSNL